MKDPNLLESESLNGSGTQDKLKEDEISLKTELEKSLFDLAKESIENGKNPEFRITISSNDEEKSIKRNTDSDQLIISSNDPSNQDGQNGTQQISGEESTIKDITKPKIYVVVKSKKNSDANGINAQGNIDNGITCSEIGNSVINLNDFISPQSKPVTGNENITTSVNFLGNDDEKSKVELVITIKDERTKTTGW